MEPLASKIRPVNLDEFIGQTHLVGKADIQNNIPAGPLRVATESKHLFSFILWGPPGVGKTTLARIYAKSLNAEYYELSAVSAGKEDIRKILESHGGLFGPKILFLDEIHRFNKAQQDFLLPAVEKGALTLIGATTENPSFEVISALLSRARIFVLNELSDADLRQILGRTGYDINSEAANWLVGMSGGDARQMLSMVENTVKLYKDITLENLVQTLQSKFLRYDKKGDEHYNTISTFIKSMRASQPDAALYYLGRMIESGEDPKFIARRMVIFASEDIGMLDLHALPLANAVFRAVETIGYPEAGINLAHGVIYLAEAPKTKAVYNAYGAAISAAKEHGNLPIPINIRNAPTKLMKDLGYGEGYAKYTKDDLMPEILRGSTFWNPTDDESGKK